ncbi:MAG: histidine kinase N-terminal 7TM domain-containing protein [Anditalea sp.]
MQFDFNVFSIILIVSGFAVILLSLFIFYRLEETIKLFAFTMFSFSLWVLAYGFEVASSNFEDMLFWVKIEYLGIVLGPSSWLLFCIKYSGKDSWLNKRVLFSVFAFPFFTYFLVLTNGWHHLYYTTVGMTNAGPFPLLAIQHGPGYYLYVSYSYLMLSGGTYLLISNFRHADPSYRNQIYLLVISVTLPWMVNVMYLLGYKPLGHIDLTPYALIFVYGLIGLGLIKLNLFDVIPIAKDKLIAAMTGGILVIDLKGKVTDINASMKKLIGLKGGKYIGKPISDLYGWHKDLMEVISSRNHQQIEIFDHVNKRYSVESIPLIEKRGGISGMLLLFKDITEERMNQNLLKIQSNQLKHHNELKDKLFSIISHDLKGPILGVKEIIDLAKKGSIQVDDFLEILPEVSKSVDGVSMLLENLLAWSKSQLKGEFTDKVVLDICKLIQEQKVIMEPIAASKEIDLQINSEGPRMVFADKDMVELVIRNLLNNAIKFCKTGDRILVLIKDEKGQVRISVKDTGVGISESNLSRLRQGDSFSTFGSNNESGTGLGLLLVRDYVEKNGDQLQIESEEHKGSEFSFRLTKVGIDNG